LKDVLVTTARIALFQGESDEWIDVWAASQSRGLAGTQDRSSASLNAGPPAILSHRT
jgi:hypothetical protein